MTNKLNKIADKAFNLLKSCTICPRKCKVNRLANQTGFCKTGLKPKVYNFLAHHGEEPPISGTQGSGTIFFSGCNMACAYCQNYKFSQLGEGKEVDFEELANFMLQLQKQGCHNINLVTPAHVMPQILMSLKIAAAGGLNIPLIYNTSGYELAEMIKLLNGIIDIYLVDMRYADNTMALKYSKAPNYSKYNQKALKEMHSQVGIATFNSNGIIERGVIVRHLVLPNNISGTEKIMRFIAKNISQDTYISLMSQYLPCYQADKITAISRRITEKEYDYARQAMDKYGLSNGWIQEDFGIERYAGTNIKSSLK